jgi:hypothetical protein
MKNVSTAAKFQVTKKVVARFAKASSVSGQPVSTSILNTSMTSI